MTCPSTKSDIAQSADALKVASAKIERQELPVHKNKMFIYNFQ